MTTHVLCRYTETKVYLRILQGEVAASRAILGFFMSGSLQWGGQQLVLDVEDNDGSQTHWSRECGAEQGMWCLDG